jgi:hypothetical protein
MSVVKKPKLLFAKQYYVDLLNKHVCVVVFEKVDGTERTLIGTTQSELLPPPKPTTDRVYIQPEHQVRLYDIQKKAWRSFTIDSVISFDIVPE